MKALIGVNYSNSNIEIIGIEIILLLTLAFKTSLEEQNTSKSYKKFTLPATENKTAK